MRLLIFFSFLFFSTSSLNGQTEEILYAAFGNGDVNSISSYFAKNVEICIGDEVDYYPKSKATNVLSDFLISVGPIRCSPLHNGASANKKSKYIIGKLESNKGTYRLFVFVKKGNGKQEINEIRLEVF